MVKMEECAEGSWAASAFRKPRRRSGVSRVEAEEAGAASSSPSVAPQLRVSLGRFIERGSYLSDATHAAILHVQVPFLRAVAAPAQRGRGA